MKNEAAEVWNSESMINEKTIEWAGALFALICYKARRDML